LDSRTEIQSVRESGSWRLVGGRRPRPWPMVC